MIWKFLRTNRIIFAANIWNNYTNNYTMSVKKNPIVIFWFRRDLRIEDNHGFYQALKSGLQVLPLFIFDTNILNQLDNKVDKRVDLIWQMLEKLQLIFLKYESTLKIEYGTPVEVFERLLTQFDVKAVYTNTDYEPYAIKRDKEVKELLATKNISFHTFKDQVIFEYDEVLKSDKTPYTVFTPYSRVWKAKINSQNIEAFPTEKLLHNLLRTPPLPLPDLNDIGFLTTGIIYSEPEIDTDIIKNYAVTRDFPALNGTTGISLHLRFGTISIRKLVKIALELSEIWLNELIWREFFMSILAWFPQVEKSAFKSKYDEIKWRNNEAEFEKWCNGKTGYPLVDAGMREMNETGLMHNRVRMVVASFLTKHLLIDWRWGEAYFAAKLLDYDLSANNGNWQWAAGCGCDAAPYFRVFNPTEQAKRYDHEMKYIRKWIPEIDSFEYPQPIVEHSFARLRALETYKNALTF